jgi:hypothetical protein
MVIKFDEMRLQQALRSTQLLDSSPGAYQISRDDVDS